MTYEELNEIRRLCVTARRASVRNPVALTAINDIEVKVTRIAARNMYEREENNRVMESLRRGFDKLAVSAVSQR